MSRTTRKLARSSILLGNGWGLHLGDGRLSDWHAHHALQLNAGVQVPVQLQLRGARPGPPRAGWLIASNLPHRLECEGPLITLFVDPNSLLATRALERLGEAEALPLPDALAKSLVQEVTGCWGTQGWRVPEAMAAVRRVMEELTASAPSPRLRDVRVERVMRLLASDPSHTHRLAELAEVAGVSPSRLTHLFRAQVGLPIRPYRLWLRLQMAARLLGQGVPATEAAYRAGFADSAHLTRTCKRIFGIPPSAMPDLTETG